MCTFIASRMTMLEEKKSLPLKGPENAKMKIIKKKGLNINKTSSDRKALHKVKVKLNYIVVRGHS